MHLLLQKLWRRTRGVELNNAATSQKLLLCQNGLKASEILSWRIWIKSLYSHPLKRNLMLYFEFPFCQVSRSALVCPCKRKKPREAFCPYVSPTKNVFFLSRVLVSPPMNPPSVSLPPEWPNRTQPKSSNTCFKCDPDFRNVWGKMRCQHRPSPPLPHPGPFDSWCNLSGTYIMAKMRESICMQMRTSLLGIRSVRCKVASSKEFGNMQKKKEIEDLKKKNCGY